MITIGQVAAKTGLRASAIRYYEAQGLLPVAFRQGGKRVYDPSVFQRLTVIELAKTAGFNLADIRGVLSAVENHQPAAAWKTLTKSKRAEIDRAMRTLTVMKRVLAGLDRCSCRSLDDCGRAFRKALAKG